MLEITEGCHVRLRNGSKHGPIKRLLGPCFVWGAEGISWHEDGSYWAVSEISQKDIVEVFLPADISPLGLPPFKAPPMPPVAPPRVADVPAIKQRRIYLSGPMQGMPERNYPAFHRVAAGLRALGHEVYNPAEYPAQGTADFPLREAFMDYARFILNEADAIVIMPNWEKSKGVAAEKALAEVVGIDVIYL